MRNEEFLNYEKKISSKLNRIPKVVKAIIRSRDNVMQYSPSSAPVLL